ncbi:MAG: TonB-dependent receptor [Tenuifilaceae bacterium]|jgi:hypothetical protein|nr:TonB-dependent receptor [Tenuifilaceae bacterium]
MRTYLRHLILISLCALFTSANAQQLTQVIKGTVVDIETQLTLPGATIVLLGTDPTLGTSTNLEGNFRIENAPLGRYNIQIGYVGYDKVVIPEVLVTSSKEVVLSIGLKQSLTNIAEVVVKANSRKDKPLNPMASISAKSFTVEETRRYAGGLDDPARMASAFAGVTVGNIQDNAIIIRGNSPKGVSWRLEGVEIPNPNHFAGGNVAGGGVVTIFSSQLLANSDFFTGAFPAEYGNALAGVFDMKLRNGNNEKRESTIQLGLMGLDFASEGYFVKGGKSSYLFNYRYSTLSLMSNLGLIPSEQIPQYQDLSFKLTFPTKKAGVFSVWGIGAYDVNKEPEGLDSSKWETDWDRIKSEWNLYMGAVGVTHKIITGKKTYINTSVALTGSLNKMDYRRLDNDMILRPNWDFSDMMSRVNVNTFVNHKFNAKHTLRVGYYSSSMFYDIDLSSTVDDIPETFGNFVKQKGESQYSEVYIQSRYSITPQLTANVGVNANYFNLNKDFSIDPRASLKWEFSPKHAFSIGYGKHSQAEELKIYFVKKEVNGESFYPNKNLKLSKAHHIILAYDWLINSNLRLKVEPYFQYLYDAPGIADSSYSLINFKQDWSFMNALENNSKGKNLGVDITLERFLNNNYYYLVTASVFDSKYMADDKVWRNTRYDKGFAVNILLGKEFFLSKQRMLGVNLRGCITGGERTSPIDTEKSLLAKRVILNEQNAFEEQEATTYNVDITITYRANKSKYSGVWALQIKNALGTPMNDGYSYNIRTKQMEKSKSTVVLPVISYKIEF